MRCKYASLRRYYVCVFISPDLQNTWIHPRLFGNILAKFDKNTLNFPASVCLFIHLIITLFGSHALEIVLLYYQSYHRQLFPEHSGYR